MRISEEHRTLSDLEQKIVNDLLKQGSISIRILASVLAKVVEGKYS